MEEKDGGGTRLIDKERAHFCGCRVVKLPLCEALRQNLLLRTIRESTAIRCKPRILPRVTAKDRRNIHTRETEHYCQPPCHQVTIDFLGGMMGPPLVDAHTLVDQLPENKALHASNDSPSPWPA